MGGFLELIESWGYALSETLKAQLQTGSAGSLLVVYAAGVLTSFTPCVYPMIPVTVTFIGGASGGDRKRAVTLSLFYVAGMALIYAALGMAAALLGQTFGKWTQSPWIYAAVGILIALFALAMMGKINIPVPGLAARTQTSGVQRGGVGGAIMMGAAAGFVAAPCTAPVLFILLLYVGQTRDMLWGGPSAVGLRGRAQHPAHATRHLLRTPCKHSQGWRVDGSREDDLLRRNVGGRGIFHLPRNKTVDKLVKILRLVALACGLVAVSLSGAAETISITLPHAVSGKALEVRSGSKALHVVFFATWCPHCVEELEQLKEFEDRWKERDYRLVVIAVEDRHDAARLKRFAAREQVPGQFVFDVDGKASVELRAADLPTHIVYDAAGNEVHRSSRLSADTVSVLRSLLAEH